MRKAVIILSVLCILLLVTTGTLGMALRRGAEDIRQIHFHIAMTTATLGIIAHIVSLIYALKNADPKPSSGEAS